MKRYVETITVKDWALARNIMLALEKNGFYSVEYRECRNHTDRYNNYHFEIIVREEERPIPHEVDFVGCPEPEENPVPKEGDTDEI